MQTQALQTVDSALINSAPLSVAVRNMLQYDFEDLFCANWSVLSMQHSPVGSAHRTEQAAVMDAPATDNAPRRSADPAFPGTFLAKHFKVVSLRETPAPESLKLIDTPERAVDYWRQVIATNPWFNGAAESLYVLFLNTRRRCVGCTLVTTGTLDTLLVHPREVFRAAVIANASAVVIMHNHPSGVIPRSVLCRIRTDLAYWWLVSFGCVRHKNG